MGNGFTAEEQAEMKKRVDEREAEVRRLAKEAGFIIKKNGLAWMLIEPGRENLWSEQVIDICKARIEVRNLPWSGAPSASSLASPLPDAGADLPRDE